MLFVNMQEESFSEAFRKRGETESFSVLLKFRHSFRSPVQEDLRAAVQKGVHPRFSFSESMQPAESQALAAWFRSQDGKLRSSPG